MPRKNVIFAPFGDDELLKVFVVPVKPQAHFLSTMLRVAEEIPIPGSSFVDEGEVIGKVLCNYGCVIAEVEGDDGLFPFPAIGVDVYAA
jgi:hypothetical protein